MSFIPKVKMDFVPEETEENEEEEIIPEAVPTTEEINPNDIFEDTKEPVNIIEESLEPIKKPRKKREYTEEQKQAMRERMAKVREARKIKGKSKIEEEQPVNRPQPASQPIQQPAPQPIQQPAPQPIQQPAVNQQQAQEAIEKMIFAGIQSYEALRKERKAKKKEEEKKQKEHEDFKNTLKRAMNRKNTNPYGNGFF